MIWYYIFLAIASGLTIMFSWLPRITSLPSILGVDIDTALTQGMGMFYSFTNAVWPIRDAFLGFIFLMTYYTIKMALKFLLGHRAPGLH